MEMNLITFNRKNSSKSIEINSKNSNSLIKVKYAFFHCLLPTFIGFLIYIFFRTKELIFFKWLSVFSSEIDSIRHYSLGIKHYIPQWIYYSLADALWTYSLTSLIMIYWINDKKNGLIIWLFIVFIFTILYEVLQIFKLPFINGTFDFYDLIFCSISYICSVLYFLTKMKKNEKR
jgi:hypothetical protein